MLRTLVRGAGRGSTKPLVIGDETIDLRAFRNTPTKGFVPGELVCRDEEKEDG